MNLINWEHMITNVLWSIIVIGWIFLIASGLEADKPMSGGLPQDAHHQEKEVVVEGIGSKIGTIGAWATFIFASVCLCVALWWIFMVHA